MNSLIVKYYQLLSMDRQIHACIHRVYRYYVCYNNVRHVIAHIYSVIQIFQELIQCTKKAYSLAHMDMHYAVLSSSL